MCVCVCCAVFACFPCLNSVVLMRHGCGVPNVRVYAVVLCCIVFQFLMLCLFLFCVCVVLICFVSECM